MQFNKLEIHNYGLFSGLHEFELSNRGLVFVVGSNLDGTRANSNGAGKSTLFEALEWCVFGDCPKQDSIDSIINQNAGNNCWVKIAITDDEGKEITIKRFRKVSKNNGVTLTVSGGDKTALDINETQKIINDLLGMTRDLFHACVFFSQTGVWKFCEKLNSDVECLEVLTKVLQLEDIDIWLVKAKADKSLIDASIEKTIMSISNYSSQLSVLTTMNFEEKIKEYEISRKEKITANLKLCAAKTTEANNLEAKVIDTTELENQLKQLEQTPVLSVEMPTRLINVNSEIGTATNQLDNYKIKYNEILKVVEDLGSNAVVRCRLCGQEISKKAAPEHIGKLTGEAEIIKQQSLALKSKIDGLIKEKEQLNLTYKQHQHENNQLQVEYNKKISTVKDQIHANASVLQSINGIKHEANKYYKDCEILKNEVNPYISEQNRVIKERNRITILVNENEISLDSLKISQEIYAFWVEAFGVKGLKSYILDNKLDSLTEAANHWIGLLTDNRFYIKFETQTINKTGKTRNKLTMRVFQLDSNNVIIEHNYLSWSGGERTRVSLGVDLGLSQLISSRSKKKYNLLIFDEIFRNLDQAGIVAVTEMLAKLALTKESIFVIEHNEQMRDNFENVVVVERKNNCSQVLK